jgi:putative spermidine/putrescine transport system substrate-binding protein
MNKKEETMGTRFTGVFSAAVIGSLVLAGLATGVHSALAEDQKQIVYLGIGGATQEALRKAYFEPFEKETGIRVVEDTGMNPARVQAEVKSGHPKFDITNLSTAAYQTLLDDDLLAPIDYKYYDPADLKSMAEGTIRQKFSVSTSYTSLGMNFSTAAFPAEGAQPKSWADFWDVKTFPGKRTMPFCGVLEGDWPLPEAALLADGVAPDKLYPIDIDRAVRKLKELSPNVIWWKNTSQPGQYIAQGEAVMSMDSVGRTNNLMDKGVAVKYVWNGAQTFSSKWIVAKGDPNYDNTMRFLAFIARPDRQIALARLIGYAPINPRAYDTMDKASAERLVTYPDNFKQTFAYDHEWWAKNLSAWTEACLNGLSE